MPIELSAEEREHLSPEEIEALTGADAEAHLAASGADEEAAAPAAAPAPAAEASATEEGAAAPAEAPAPAPAAEAPAPAPAPAETPSAEALAEIAEGQQREAPFVPTFQGTAPEKYVEQRADLLKQKGAALKQLMDGEIDAEQYAAVEADVTSKLDDLNAARIRAETLTEAQAQAQASLHQREIVRIMNTAKKAGEIDYATDRAAQVQFDAILSGLVAGGSGKDFGELCDEAHQALLAVRGIVKAPPPPAHAPAPAAQAPAAAPAPAAPPAAGPRTLAGLPNAGAAGVSDDISAKLATLSGEDAELFLAQLPPAQVERLLKSATTVI